MHNRADTHQSPLQQLTLTRHYQQLPAQHYQRTKPIPLRDAWLVSVNHDVAQRLGLALTDQDDPLLTDYASGRKLFHGSDPLAMKYTGHQFGVYNPQLGDGRGLLLGEYRGPDGILRDLHLKGSGRTSYSRFGDGRAVLRSTIREYLASAAMTGLGIPTTEALSVVGSSETVLRDGFAEPCAMLLRVTPCHIRFGHFEYLYHSRQTEDLAALSRYVITRYYPESANDANPPLALIREVIRRNAHLVAHWQAYGFVHGVMNSDNISILGETFDYGPFQFMDRYRSDHVSNRSDDQGRYAFKRQPDAMHRNLFCLAECFIPLVSDEGPVAQKLLEAELAEFPEYFRTEYLRLMRRRLGLEPLTDQAAADSQLIDELWRLLEIQKTDITLFFRKLSEYPAHAQQQQLAHICQHPSAFELWLQQYHQRLAAQSLAENIRLLQMQQVNPVYLLRHNMAEDAIRLAYEGKTHRINELLMLLRDPFRYHTRLPEYAGPAPEDARTGGLSCAS